MKRILEVNGLSGGYVPEKPVIHDLNFHVASGEIVGLIGLNGAGKSTTIKHVLGLMEPMKGTAAIAGKTFREEPDEYRGCLSYIPETPVLYDELTLWEHLELTAMAYGLEEKTFLQRVRPLLEEFHMENKIKWFPSEFSKGMKQKVMILCALLVEPDLYVVDEPFVGLDPIGIQSFLDYMVRFRNNGAGILMSTHILSTAEKYCDRFLIMHNGHMVLKGTLKQLQEETGLADAGLDDIYLLAARGGKL
ncbi:ABC transporter ATP-binding protein [Fictibacillus aquaticus]|uniref:Multidrug ABC transporter ATP-binding protein n=1 Tax=Fictibacillus aquaticus TaxID=2021314 RepID=A0A235FED0_9BACL|nr:ABC transporter ATP-binding protein [Fictibacillus aquaticus]OYD59708.1 multidrug ABC transporter ATP-binding protein [Fictibacillus aquaticus]